MVDVNQDLIYGVLDEQTADNLCRYLAGCRVSFSKHEIEHKDIYRNYLDLMRVGCVNSEAIRSLAMQFDKSESQIRRIIKKWKKR